MQRSHEDHSDSRSVNPAAPTLPLICYEDAPAEGWQLGANEVASQNHSEINPEAMFWNNL
jgi:hypothetical protein